MTNSSKLIHKRITRLGILQLVTGLICIVCGLFSIFGSQPIWTLFPLTTAAPGIWFGLLILITGIFAISTSRSAQRKKFMLTGFAIMTMVTLVAAVAALAITIVDITQVVRLEIKYDYKMEELRKHNNLGPEEKVSCLNLTIGDVWDATGNSTTTTSSVTGSPVTATAPLQHHYIPCIARSSFDQKFAFGGILLFCSIFELVLIGISLYVAQDIRKSYNTDQRNESIDLGQNASRINTEIPIPSINEI